LRKDSKNVKAIFRRATAFVALGDYEAALEDFKGAQELEPNNKATINQIAICKHKLKQYHEQEKARYKNMFARLSTTPKPVAGNEEFVKFGEWSDQERSHTPTEFEKENPNILMVENEHNQEFKNM
jgi:tetratricopeptide (TPR) repeat protein